MFKKIFNKLTNILANKISESFESTIKFLMKGDLHLDDLKYLENNPYIELISDTPNPLVKGREHIVVIKLVQSNYRLSKEGTIFIIASEDIERCKSYDFSYTYYQFDETDENPKLNYVGFNIDMQYDPDKKTIQV